MTGNDVVEHDGATTLWCGEYRFGQDDFLRRADGVARKYVNKPEAARPPEPTFHAAMAILRRFAPVEATAVVEQLEHRWAHPNCPKALYALTCSLRPRGEGGALLDNDGTHVQELLCTKVGSAKNTIADRLMLYRKKGEPLGGADVVPGSQVLRMVVYGRGPAMIVERQLQHLARGHATRAQRVDAAGKVDDVGSETFIGSEVLATLQRFAREHTQQHTARR
jgi:hypothetical protein